VFGTLTSTPRGCLTISDAESKSAESLACLHGHFLIVHKTNMLVVGWLCSIDSKKLKD
jgi:hypothetical protein